MYNNPPSYVKLSQQSPDVEEEQESFLPSKRSSSPSRVYKWRRIAIISCVLNVVLVLAGLTSWARSDRKDSDAHWTLLYSPANEAIEYQVTRFHASFPDNDPTPYTAPGREADALWEDLYGFGISAVSKEEASRFHEHTDLLTVAGEKQYVTELAVFHQLHCLNIIRMAFDPENHQDMKKYFMPDHIGHCIDSIRQALQCSADVTPLPWQWVPELKEYRGRLGIEHSCRNFDKIRDWARPRKTKDRVNQTFYVEPE